MKIRYEDKRTKDYVDKWLINCTHTSYALNMTDIFGDLAKDTPIYTNLFLVNKNNLFKRIINETNCFNSDVEIAIKINDEYDSLIMDFLTSEGEKGHMILYFGNFDGYPGIGIIQDDKERVFRYDYSQKNPLLYDGNLLEEKDQREKKIHK